MLNNELVKPVFAQPKNENERNLNAKYVRVNWLEDCLLTGVISPLDFVNVIKERVFTLVLIDYLTEKMKKMDFFFCLPTEEEQREFPNMQTIFKKYDLAYLET